MYTLLVIALVMHVSAQSTPTVNSTALLDAILAEQAEALIELENEALYQWRNATMSMALLNTALDDVIGALTMLYGAENATFFNSTLAAAAQGCAVLHAEEYIANATQIQAFYCCHLAILRFPALLRVIAQATYVYHGAYIDDNADNTQPALIGLETMQYLDYVGFVVARCMGADEGAATMRAQQNAVRAIGALAIGGYLLEAYEAIYLDAISLRGCIGAPTDVTGCYYNDTITLAQVPLNMVYGSGAGFDEAYLNVCGGATLSAFNALPNTVSCVSIPPY
jgi:hypothetical protein